MENKTENIMGTMPEGRLLFKLALPMIFSVLVSSLYNIVDSIFVGRIGQGALTAISLGAPASSLMVELSFGVAVGVNAVLSRKLGEKDKDGVSRAAGQGFLLVSIVYLIFLVFGIFGIRKFFSIQTSDTEIISLGVEYTSLVTTCSFGLMLQSIVERLLSSTGRTNGSMAVLLTGAITNIILDPILIFGYFGLPAMGMKGAAIATVIGQCAAGCVGLILNLKWNKDIEFHLKSLLPDFGMIKEIMTIAIPTTLTYSINSILIFGMNQVLVRLSLAAPAVYVIYNRVRSFVALPVWGIRNTIISVVAYNMGAEYKDRVRKLISIAMKSSAAIMVIGTILYEAIPSVLLKIFSASDEMLGIGIPAFRIIGITLIISGMTIMMSGVFQAMNNSGKALVVSIVQAVVLVGSATILSLTKSTTLVWLSFPISEIVIFILSIAFMKKIYRENLA
ncbi:MAG: MATE family efflux transporter [Clostridia bacterium]|nr:MATE family efflux transporter [Clostridia bacterium]